MSLRPPTQLPISTQLAKRSITPRPSSKVAPTDPMTRVGPNNTLIVIPLNFGYLEFAINLLCSIRRLDISNYVFLAMDVKVFDTLLEMGLPAYMDRDLPHVMSEAGGWGQGEFTTLLCHKLIPVLNLLKKGINVILADADLVFLRDPRVHLRWDVDFTFSIGSCELTLPDNADPIEHPLAKVNTGFFLARASAFVIETLTRAHDQCAGRNSDALRATVYDYIDDQDSLNDILKEDADRRRSRADPRIMYTYGFLNACLFANGCVYFKHLCKNQSCYNEEVLVHANFLIGKKEKIRNLNRTGHWNATCIAHVMR